MRALPFISTSTLLAAISCEIKLNYHSSPLHVQCPHQQIIVLPVFRIKSAQTKYDIRTQNIPEKLYNCLTQMLLLSNLEKRNCKKISKNSWPEASTFCTKPLVASLFMAVSLSYNHFLRITRGQEKYRPIEIENAPSTVWKLPKLALTSL